jgi:hypothetical protein
MRDTVGSACAQPAEGAHQDRRWLEALGAPQRVPVVEQQVGALRRRTRDAREAGVEFLGVEAVQPGEHARELEPDLARLPARVGRARDAAHDQEGLTEHGGIGLDADHLGHREARAEQRAQHAALVEHGGLCGTRGQVAPQHEALARAGRVDGLEQERVLREAAGNAEHVLDARLQQLAEAVRADRRAHAFTRRS